MIRIRAGQSWKLNPSYVAPLRRLDSRAARRFGMGSILDALGVEIDGADVSRGHAEAAIVPAVTELGDVVLRLCREPTGRGQVPLVEGRAELVLGRRGSSALLCLVSLARPARLLAGELEVELHALARAAARCAMDLAGDLQGINPALALNRDVRGLRARATALQKAARLGRGGAPERDAGVALRGRPAPHTRAVSLGFALFDDEARIGAHRGGADLFSLLARGEVALHAGEAAVRLGDAPPFLVLTDLVRGARELIDACADGDARWATALGGATAPLEVDLARGEVRLGRERIACRPLELARAFLEGALDFAGAVRARNPAQEGNAYLAALAETATERLAHLDEVEAGDLFADAGAPVGSARRSAAAEPPLSAAGSLKRMRFRRVWAGLDAGPNPRLVHLERGLGLVVGDGAATFFDAATGAVRARRASETAQVGAGVVLSARGARLEAFELSGEARFLREGGGAQAAVSAIVAAHAMGARGESGLVCVLDRHLVVGMLAQTGRAVWQFEAPQAGRVFAVGGRERVYVAADNGAVYGLNAATGRVAFRVRTGCAFATPLALGGRMVVGIGRKDGALQVVGLDASSGRPRLVREVAMLAAGAPASARGLVVVAGVANRSAAVAAYRRDGGEQFSLTLPGGGGVPALAIHRDRIYAVQREGSVACVDLRGEIVWAVPGTGRELERAMAPAVRRGVVVVPGEPVRVLDAERGALLAELPPGGGLSALAVGRDLSIVLFDDDGVGTGYRVATHLSVV